jgi:hypothetical protein
MSIVERAAAVLAKAESDLKELLALAAQEGDYAAILRIAAWARSVHDLSAGGNKVSAVLYSPSGRGHAQVAGNGVRSKPPASSRVKGKHAPTFFRSGDELVLQALSKREMREYRHKASYAVLEALRRVMEEKGAGGRVFTTDEILPVRHLGSEEEVPNYQAYVGISFLKHTGAIEQHGRSGYSIPNSTDFATTVDRLWKNLPTMQ